MTSKKQCALWKRLASIRGLRPLAAAHRGFSFEYPENTLVSFAAGIEAGADLIELDFQPTRDGVLVCVHDGELTRYVGAELRARWEGRPIDGADFSELSELDVGTWKGRGFAGARIPTLAQALEAIGPGAIPFIERKGGSPKQTLDVLRRCNAVDRVIVHAFDWDYLSALHSLEPRVVLGALGGGEFIPEHLRHLRSTGASMVHWSHPGLTAEAVQKLKSEQYLVQVYTLNDESAFSQALSVGVDGISTDRPDLLLRFLNADSARNARR